MYESIVMTDESHPFLLSASSIVIMASVQGKSKCLSKSNITLGIAAATMCNWWHSGNIEVADSNPGHTPGTHMRAGNPQQLRVKTRWPAKEW